MIVSAMRVYPIPSEYNHFEILKFTCVQFTASMEVIVVAQRGALISPDYKLTNVKDGIGKILSGKGTYCSKQLPPYIPGLLSSDILSKPWRHFINEHILQPRVDKNARVRSHDDSRTKSDEESAPAPFRPHRRLRSQHSSQSAAGHVPPVRHALRLCRPAREPQGEAATPPAPPASFRDAAK